MAMTKEEKREYNKLYLKEWRKDPFNREKLKGYRKKWQNAENNKDKVRGYDKKYKDTHKEICRARGREHYSRNKEHCILISAAYSKTPKGRLVKRVCDNKRRGAEGSFTAEDIKDLYSTQGGSCYYCSVDIEGGYHIEHMTPLSRGGRNDVSNICLACAPCNLRKHTKTAEEFQSAAP